MTSCWRWQSSQLLNPYGVAVVNQENHVMKWKIPFDYCTEVPLGEPLWPDFGLLYSVTLHQLEIMIKCIVANRNSTILFLALMIPYRRRRRRCSDVQEVLVSMSIKQQWYFQVIDLTHHDLVNWHWSVLRQFFCREHIFTTSRSLPTRMPWWHAIFLAILHPTVLHTLWQTLTHNFDALNSKMQALRILLLSKFWHFPIWTSGHLIPNTLKAFFS